MRTPEEWNAVIDQPCEHNDTHPKSCCAPCTVAVFAACQDEVVEECARLAETQAHYPDTVTGARQEWVKDQIAGAIRALRPTP